MDKNKSTAATRGPEADRGDRTTGEVPNPVPVDEAPVGQAERQTDPRGASPTAGAHVAAVQEARLELDEWLVESDEEDSDAARTTPSGDERDGSAVADLLSSHPFAFFPETLESGSGASPRSGGVGEYRDFRVGRVGEGLWDAEAPQTLPRAPVFQGVSGASDAVGGPAWTAGEGLGPVFVAPMSYSVIVGTTAGEKLYGEDRPTHILGLAGGDRLYGGARGDWLQGGDGNDRVYGDAGDDRVDGDDGNDRLYGESGRDTIDGGDGNDRLYGGDDADWLVGGNGNDQIYGEAGADGLLGGAGDDKLYIDADDRLINGGTGQDTVYVQTAAGVWLDLQASDIERAYGHDGDDVFDGSALSAVARLDGGGGDDVLLGGSANDRLYGRVGDDTLAGGDGADYLYGGDGNDQLSGGLGNDRLYGEGDDDALFGEDGNDRLYGGDGNDSLDGGAGNDTLYGDAGADSLLGGAGNDKLYVDAADTLINGGAGTDTVYVQTAAAVSLDLALSEVEYAHGHDGNDVFDASSLAVAVRLYGENGDDSLLGGGAADRLSGGAGEDDLAGGDGNDRLYGDDGADVLEGGAGNDRLYGGDGGDSFVFSLSFNADASRVTGPGADRIFDFNGASGDRLVFADMVDIDSDWDTDLDDLFALEADDRLQVVEKGSRVVLSFNDGGSITLDGWATGAIDSLQDLIDAGAAVAVS